MKISNADQISQKRIDDLIEDLSDEDLADLKPMAMGRIDLQSQKLLENRKVRESRWLRSIVFDILIGDMEKKIEK